MVSRRMFLKTLGMAAAPSVSIGTGSAEPRCTDLCLTQYERTLAEAESLEVLGRPRSWSNQGMDPPPTQISSRAFVAAAHLLTDYFMPSAERVYGDSTAAAKRTIENGYSHPCQRGGSHS